MRITFADVQRNVAEIANRQGYTIDVLYELMAAYGRSASSITKLRNGVINLAENKETTVLQKGVVYFKNVLKSNSLPAEVEKLEQDPLTVRYNPRFLIATDFKTFAAKDTKKGNTLEIKWQDIDRNVDFFYGWTGDEVVDEKTEAAADRRAADKMKELYVEVEKVNADRLAEKNSKFRHELNVFFTRLLFCFFAEDTHVFAKDGSNIFTSSIKDFTQSDGRDLDQFLGTLFEVLDTKDNREYTSPFSNFPYVNGSLFDKKKGITIPKFNAQARKLILDCGALNWAEINPDIFGSMFQSIVDDKTNTMHYTSVPNIMKTIEPLFMDELREEFDKNYDNKNKLHKLHDRISRIKVFDPACGSGNFLIIAYKELRKLEHAIIDRVFEEDYKRAALAGKLNSRIDLNSFYGIEIDDFACEVAVLSLYIAKHQMNIEFEKQFGKRIELIPLEDKANIVRGNAAQLDWMNVCPNKKHSNNLSPNVQEKLIADDYEQERIELETDYSQWDEIYLISNPPYAGSRKQYHEQKLDIDFVFSEITERHRSMDYVAIWFYKAALWLGKNDRAAFSLVSTNSITQGLQIELVWPLIFKLGLKIDYAYTSFRWQNSATKNAGITCVIVAMSHRKVKDRFIISDFVRKSAKEISPYLTDTTHAVSVGSRQKPLSDFPEMNFGNMPADGGHLILSENEKSDLINMYPLSKDFIYELIGAKELIQSKNRRWCLWLLGVSKEEIEGIPEIKKRVEAVRTIRLKSSRPELAKTPELFAQITANPTQFKTAIVLPSVSSERRDYMPIRLLQNKEVVTNLCLVIPGAELNHFTILTSRMHMVWLRAVGGKMKTDYRYSKNIVYNNFPLRPLAPQEIADLTQTARNILFVRENYSNKTLAELYDPVKMPEDLREVHRQNDILVDRLYRQKPYENDDERLVDLFALYEQMIIQEESQK